MAFIDVGSGSDLIIRIPTKRTINWADQLRTDCFLRIAEHDHSGSQGPGIGMGRPIQGAGIVNNGINDTKIRLRNNEWLRGRNSTDNADIDIIKVNSGNNLELGTILDGPEIVNLKTVPVSSDPLSPEDGQLQYSDGTHRTQGIWQYQTDTWINIQGEVGTNSVNTAAIQNLAVTEQKIADNAITNAKMADNSVGTAEIINGAVTDIKITGPIDLSKLDVLSGSTLDIYNNATSSPITVIPSSLHNYYRINNQYTGGSELFVTIGNSVVKSGAIIVIKNLETSLNPIRITGLANSTFPVGAVLILRMNGTTPQVLYISEVNKPKEITLSAGNIDVASDIESTILVNCSAYSGGILNCRPGQKIVLWKTTAGAANVNVTIANVVGTKVVPLSANSLRNIYIRDVNILTEANQTTGLIS